MLTTEQSLNSKDICINIILLKSSFQCLINFWGYLKIIMSFCQMQTLLTEYQLQKVMSLT